MLKALIQFIVLASILLPAASLAEPVTLKFSFISSDRSYHYLAGLKQFVDAVNAEAKEIVQIEVYFSNSLGKLERQAQLVADGVADIAFVVPAYTPDRFSDETIIELPGLFRDIREATLVYTRLVAANALKGYDDFVVIGALATEPESIHTRMPVASLDDLQGRKIRVHSAAHGRALEKLGMVPVFWQVNDISSAISNGLIDGAAVPPTILAEYGVGRILGNHYMLRTSAAAVTVLMNRRKFEGLPAQAQNIIRKYSGEWYAARFIETLGAYNAQIVKQLESDPRRKVVFPSPVDMKRADAAFAAVIADSIEGNSRSRALLQAAAAELARIRGNE